MAENFEQREKGTEQGEMAERKRGTKSERDLWTIVVVMINVRCWLRHGGTEIREREVQLVDEEDNNRVKERYANSEHIEEGIRMEKREGSNVVYQFEGVAWSFPSSFFFQCSSYIYKKNDFHSINFNSPTTIEFQSE